VTTTSLRMAWRNLWRHTQRTVLMIAIVAFGSWVILVMWGIADGMIRSMTNTQIVYNLGDLQLRAVGYADDPVPSNGLTAKQVLAAQQVLADANVDASSARLETSGMLRSAYGSDGVIIRGIDPLKMAASLDIRLGERVVLLAQGESGTSSQAFRAVGFFANNLGTLDSIAVISLDDAHAMSGWSGLTSIAINLPTGASTRRNVSMLEKDLAAADIEGIEVADYFALNPFARIMIQGSTIKMIPMVIMIALMAGFGVANTAFYSVLERTREFGMMMALGMSRKLLARVVLMESVFVSAIGFVVGGSVGYGCLLYLSRHGFSLGGLMTNFSELGIPTTLYASTSGWYWVAAFSVVVFTALVAAWYPARRAGSLEPVTAIREG